MQITITIEIVAAFYKKVVLLPGNTAGWVLEVAWKKNGEQMDPVINPAAGPNDNNAFKEVMEYILKSVVSFGIWFLLAKYALMPYLANLVA